MPRCVHKLQAYHLDLILLLLLVVIALAPRLVLQLYAPVFRGGDSSGYVGPAKDLFMGEGLTNRLKRPMGYPLLLAGTFAIFGPHLEVLAAIQHLLGIITVVLTYLLGRACFSRWVGFGAGALVAVSGPQLLSERFVMAEPLFSVLLVGLALALIHSMRATSHKPALLVGALLGALSLVKPIGQSLLPLALAFAALRPGRWAGRIGSAALLIVTFGVIVAPWMFLNLVIHNQFSVGGALGDSLLARTLHHSCGVFVFDSPSLPPEPDPARLAARRIIQASVRKCRNPSVVRDQIKREVGLSELETERLFRQLSVDAIQRQPLDFAAEVLKSVPQIYRKSEGRAASRWGRNNSWEGRAFQDYVKPLTPEQAANSSRAQAILDFYQPWRYGAVLPLLAVLGLLAAWRASGSAGPPMPAALVPGALVLSLLLLHLALDGPVTRYRYATEPLLNVLAMGGVWTALRYANRLLCHARGLVLTQPFGRLRSSSS